MVQFTGIKLTCCRFVVLRTRKQNAKRVTRSIGNLSGFSHLTRLQLAYLLQSVGRKLNYLDSGIFGENHHVNTRSVPYTAQRINCQPLHISPWEYLMLTRQKILKQLLVMIQNHIRLFHDNTVMKCNFKNIVIKLALVITVIKKACNKNMYGS